MRRRELLLLGKRLLVVIMGGKFLGGCQWLPTNRSFHSQLTYLIAYLLYDTTIPSRSIDDIEKHVQRTINGSLEKQIEKGILSGLDAITFEALSAEDKRDTFAKILPQLLKHQEILDIVDYYLREGRALEYIDYPDLAGEFGECGWLVMEGAAWDRYYPHPGS